MSATRSDPLVNTWARSNPAAKRCDRAAGPHTKVVRFLSIVVTSTIRYNKIIEVTTTTSKFQHIASKSLIVETIEAMQTALVGPNL